MSRVNSKIVKQRLNEKRSKITDSQFFSSRVLAGHFEDIAAAQTRRYNYRRRVRVNLYWKPKAKEIAQTDNSFILINSGNKMVTDIRGRLNRYQIVTGLFAHELGHVLYTDFLSSQTYNNSFPVFRWYPEPPELQTSSDARNEKDFWEYLKLDQKNVAVVQYLVHEIWNCLEDGYIEMRMLNNFPGTLGDGLETFRDLHLKSMPTVTQLLEQEESGERQEFESILQLILCYAKFGEIKYGDEPLSNERIQTVFSLLDTIDDSLMNHSGKERLKAVNKIMIRCWEQIREYCELIKERQKEAEAAGKLSSSEEIAEEMLQSVAGRSSVGTGSTAPVTAKSDEDENDSTGASRLKTRADAEKSKEESEGKTAQTETGKNENSSESEGTSAGNGDVELLPGESPCSPSEKQEVSDTEQGRIALRQTESVSEPIGGTTEVNSEYEAQRNERAASDIERVLDVMAEKAACSELESERLRELNEMAQSLSYGNIHAGVNVRINRITNVNEQLVEQYQAISAPLLNISRQLQKSLLRQLEDSRKGGKQTGLLMGRRLDAHTVHRNDGKIFCKNVLPNEIPQLTVGLLLDESGSMRSCHRCTYARASAIILYDFCRSLNIPVTVYGHSTGYSTVELFSYAEFESIDNDDKYRMMDIGARGSNRDGAALRFVAEKLVRRPEQVKILILVSDGQPADCDYYGTAAEEDLRGIKQEYKRKGILFVAAAIGDDKQNIERIYGDSFLDITDLNQLPTKLTSVVKRHIRV